MNKTKRGLQLGAAITNIVFSSLLILGSILLLSEMQNIINSYGPEYSMLDTEAIDFAKAIYVMIILFSAANIIISSLICTKPKNNNHKGLVITSLTLNSVMAVLYLTSGSFYTILPLACVGLYIAALCIKAETPAVNTTGTLPSVNNVAAAPAPAASNVEPTEAVTSESALAEESPAIAKYRKMYEDGVITQQEMDALIAAELNK